MEDQDTQPTPELADIPCRYLLDQIAHDLVEAMAYLAEVRKNARRLKNTAIVDETTGMIRVLKDRLIKVCHESLGSNVKAQGMDADSNL